MASTQKTDTSKDIIPLELKKHWSNDPVMFIETCFTTPDGNPIVLSLAQKKIVWAIKNSKKVSLQTGTGLGKTAILSLMIIWGVLVINPIKIVVLAPASGQAETGLWTEIMKWLSYANPIVSSALTQARDMVYNIARPANKMIKRAYDPGNEESVQGIHEDNCWVVIDEATGVPTFVFNKMRNVFTSLGGKMLIAFNPTKTDTYAERTQTILTGWTRLKYNIFHPDCQREGFDPESVAAEYRDDPRTAEGTCDWSVMIMGEFWYEEDDDTLLTRDMLAQAQKPDDEKPTPLDGPVIWGVDVGGASGRDRTAISKRRRNIKLEPTTFLEGKRTNFLTEWLKQQYEETPPGDRPDAIYIDCNGVGLGVYDHLLNSPLPVKQHYAVAEMQNPKRYANRKAELCFRMRDWFKDPSCYIPPDDDEFIEDCSDIRYLQMENNAKYKIEEKKKMLERGKRSTDGFDSFMMTFEDITTLNPKKKKKKEKQERPAWLR